MTGKTPQAGPTFARAARGLAGWLGEGTRVGRDLLGSVQLPSLPRTGSSCEVPPPCWAPQPLGAVTARACPGTKAVVRLDITNTDAITRTITVSVTGGAATITPPSLDLGPLEEGLVVLSFDVPPTDTEGLTRKLLVWVDGCQRHYLRWTVVSTCSGQECCVELPVEDGADPIHHWYDHFYCQHGCLDH
jgi:hypothetical protein